MVLAACGRVQHLLSDVYGALHNLTATRPPLCIPLLLREHCEAARQEVDAIRERQAQTQEQVRQIAGRNRLTVQALAKFGNMRQGGHAGADLGRSARASNDLPPLPPAHFAPEREDMKVRRQWLPLMDLVRAKTRLHSRVRHAERHSLPAPVLAPPAPAQGGGRLKRRAHSALARSQPARARPESVAYTADEYKQQMDSLTVAYSRRAAVRGQAAQQPSKQQPAQPAAAAAGVTLFRRAMG